MKKKWQMIWMLLAGMLMAVGCNVTQHVDTQQSEQPQRQSSLSLQLDEYPTMDGSTANLPMMAQVMSKVCRISLQEAEEKTSCSTTQWAWYNIATGEADILLVYEASEGTKEDLARLGTELEIIPVGRDALVFITHVDNPVDNLTTQELTDIYTGSITNWQEIGGNDEAIVAYQRDENSGSQALFMKLLMQGQSPMNAPTEFMPSEMGALIDALASYKNTMSALGYSVFYYASYMYQQPDLKFLAVDGVMPSDITIADGSYPFLNEYYVVIRADAPADSPARKLRDWILSDEGKEMMVTAGYIPLR